MYCIIHGKGARHTSKMCPKVKKSIEEAQEENWAPSQSKLINHVRQGQQSSHQTYYTMHYGHAQALLLGPPPAYSYEPCTIPYKVNGCKINLNKPMYKQYNLRLQLQITTLKIVKPNKKTTLHQPQR